MASCSAELVVLVSMVSLFAEITALHMKSRTTEEIFFTP